MQYIIRLLPVFLLSFSFCACGQQMGGTKAPELIKSYLKEIQSVAIDFVQTDSNGEIASGKLLISKPYKFRCNYYSPFPLIVVGNKNYISVYDYDLEQINRISSAENVFALLLNDEISFEKQFIVESIVEQGDILKFKVRSTEFDQISSLTFNRKTKQLQTIEIFENANVITINLGNAIKVVSFDKELFILKNPKTFGPPERLEKEGIEKRYKTST